MRQFKCQDHRPFVLILAPLMYTVIVLLDNLEADKVLDKLSLALGITFSLVIVPISVILAWRQKRGDTACKKSQAE
jgi:ABC-type Fe3+-siderophore transport system permease subunit